MAMNLTPNQPQINVTPLIDVLLVLLIIFLLITPHQSKGLKALAPQPPEENVQTAAPPQPIVVEVAADRSLKLNTTPVAIGSLAEELQRIFARRPSRVLFVQGEASLDYGDVAKVIDIAHGAGIYEVALMKAR